jgi:hypothetical protein
MSCFPRLVRACSHFVVLRHIRGAEIISFKRENPNIFLVSKIYFHSHARKNPSSQYYP